MHVRGLTIPNAGPNETLVYNFAVGFYFTQATPANARRHQEREGA
jgi:hypothetical protein